MLKKICYDANIQYLRNINMFHVNVKNILYIHM